MNVLIVEGEELAVLKLTKLLAEVAPQVKVAGTSASVCGTVAYLASNPSPDLIFMDIELADGQSFEIFEQISVPSPVIFTTSYDEFAIKAFKVNSIDYLLKPIKRQELAASLRKHQQLYGNKNEVSVPSIAMDLLIEQLRKQVRPLDYRSRFLVRHLSQWLPISVTNIAYFYSEDGVTFFRTSANQKFTIDYALDELDNMLDPKLFTRANRKFIVHIDAVQQIHAYFNNKLKVILKPAIEEEVLISREKASEFKRWMGK